MLKYPAGIFAAFRGFHSFSQLSRGLVVLKITYTRVLELLKGCYAGLHKPRFWSQINKVGPDFIKFCLSNMLLFFLTVHLTCSSNNNRY